MAFTEKEEGDANKLAQQLLDLNPRLHMAAAEISKRQSGALAVLDSVGGGTPRHPNDLRIAEELVNDASTAWRRAKKALREDEDLEAATGHFKDAFTCFEQADAILSPPSAPKPAPPVKSGDKKVAGTDKTSAPQPPLPSPVASAPTSASAAPQPGTSTAKPTKEESDLNKALKVLLDPEKGVEAQLKRHADELTSLREEVDELKQWREDGLSPGDFKLLKDKQSRWMQRRSTDDGADSASPDHK